VSIADDVTRSSGQERFISLTSGSTQRFDPPASGGSSSSLARREWSFSLGEQAAGTSSSLLTDDTDLVIEEVSK
jgi:hypothetical protein